MTIMMLEFLRETPHPALGINRLACLAAAAEGALPPSVVGAAALRLYLVISVVNAMLSAEPVVPAILREPVVQAYAKNLVSSIISSASSFRILPLSESGAIHHSRSRRQTS